MLKAIQCVNKDLKIIFCLQKGMSLEKADYILTMYERLHKKTTNLPFEWFVDFTLEWDKARKRINKNAKI